VKSKIEILILDAKVIQAQSKIHIFSKIVSLFQCLCVGHCATTSI